MKQVSDVFELQIDEKPNGGVIRLNNSKGQCILRICSIRNQHLKLIDIEKMPFIDITCSTTTMVTITDSI